MGNELPPNRNESIRRKMQQPLTVYPVPTVSCEGICRETPMYPQSVPSAPTTGLLLLINTMNRDREKAKEGLVSDQTDPVGLITSEYSS